MAAVFFLGTGTDAGADMGADTGAGAAQANVPTRPVAASDLTSPSPGAGGGVWRGIKIERRHGRRERELVAVEERQDAATSVPEGTTPRSGRPPYVLDGSGRGQSPGAGAGTATRAPIALPANEFLVRLEAFERAQELLDLLGGLHVHQTSAQRGHRLQRLLVEKQVLLAGA